MGRAYGLAVADDLLIQHRALRAALDAIDADVARRPDLPARAGWRQRIGADLERLLGHLRGSFGKEEAAGLFEDVERTLPESERICARLRSEHPALLAKLEAARDRAAAGDGTDESDEALRRVVRELFADLSRHEEEERALVFRAFERDRAAALD
jgi:hypothetical protein